MVITGSIRDIGSSWWSGPVVVYLLWLFFVTVPYHPVVTLRDSIMPIVVQWSVYLFPLLAIFLLGLTKRGAFWRSLGLRRKGIVPGLVWVLALGLIFNLIIMGYSGLVRAMTGFSPEEKVMEYFERAYPDWYFTYMLVFVFVPVGLVEELVFRGFILDRFLVKGPFFAISASSLMHSLMHIWYVAIFGHVGLPLFGTAFLASTYFGLVYYKSRNVLWPIIFHGISDVGVPLRHFFGPTPLVTINALRSVGGVVCLVYLVYRRLKAPRAPGSGI